MAKWRDGGHGLSDPSRNALLGSVNGPVLQARDIHGDVHVRTGCAGRDEKPCADYVPLRPAHLEVSEEEVGRADTGDTTYGIGGSVVECRFRNVLIRVDWRGADHPPDVAGKIRLQGKDLAYEESRRYAATVVRAVIAKLSRSG